MYRISKLIFMGALLVVGHSSCARAESKPICDGKTQPPGRFVLFAMFLTAPPRENDPDWELKSVSTSEFESCSSCISAAQSVANSLRNVPTITSYA